MVNSKFDLDRALRIMNGENGTSFTNLKTRGGTMSIDLSNISTKDLKKAIQDRKEVELKVSQKGCIQINGIRRFPISLYVNEFNKIVESLPKIQQFVKDHAKELA